MENAFVFKHACFNTQKEITRCYPPIYNSPQKYQNVSLRGCKRTLTEIFLQPFQSSVTSLNTHFSIIKGDALTDKQMKLTDQNPFLHLSF